MSTQKSTSSSGGVVVQKPRSDVYTMMLIVSFVALVISCILLYLELGRYGGFG